VLFFVPRGLVPSRCQMRADSASPAVNVDSLTDFQHEVQRLLGRALLSLQQCEAMVVVADLKLSLRFASAPTTGLTAQMRKSAFMGSADVQPQTARHLRILAKE
jgi:hypothetical protein